jgi:hypothetical protein
MIKDHLKLWAKALFFYSGTFLHETTHYIASILTLSRVTNFSLKPSVEYDKKTGRKIGEQFGEVRFIPRVKALSFIIGLAPLSLWVLLWWILKETEFVIAYESSFQINYERVFDLEYAWVWFAMIQLIRSGFPSSADIRLSYMGLFSLSGIFMIGGMVAAYQYSNELFEYYMLAKEYVFQL